MKKITAFLLCFLLFCSFSIVASAEDFSNTENGGTSVISVSVPYTHTVTVSSTGAKVFFNGVSGTNFTVDRLSEPTVLIRAKSGKKISQVLLNGEDITTQVKGGCYTFSPVFEDKELKVITEGTSATPQSNTYTVKGTVKRSGKPVENVTLELRSSVKTTVKTAVTDTNGKFQFDDVECGRHSLTALENGKVVGYLEFELNEGEDTEFNLQSDGLYKVTVKRNEMGIDLTLNLTDNSAISIDSISEVQKPADGASEPTNATGKPSDGASPPTNATGKPADEAVTSVSGKSPQTGDYISIWFWVVLISMGGIVIKLAVYDRKKKPTE